MCWVVEKIQGTLHNLTPFLSKGSFTDFIYRCMQSKEGEGDAEENMCLICFYLGVTDFFVLDSENCFWASLSISCFLIIRLRAISATLGRVSRQTWSQLKPSIKPMRPSCQFKYVQISIVTSETSGVCQHLSTLKRGQILISLTPVQIQNNSTNFNGFSQESHQHNCDQNPAKWE